jgi:hypothetical protein
VKGILAAALVGVVHLHHAPSHDTDAPFSDLVGAAHEAGLDFLVLTEHSDRTEDGPLPGASLEGIHRSDSGHRVLVLVGAEFGTADGHLIGLDIPRAYANQDEAGEMLPGRDLIERIHADGGFAVVPHPFSHGGWEDWDAPFDGIEVQNNASDYRRQVGPLYPLRLIRFSFDPDGGLASMLCPDGPLEVSHVWGVLRSGRCSIRWRVHERPGDLAREVRFPSVRAELWLDGGRRELELRNPPPGAPPEAPPRSPGAPRSP